MRHWISVALLLLGCKGSVQQAQVLAAYAEVREKANPDAPSLLTRPPQGTKVGVRTLPFYDSADFYVLETGGFIRKGEVALLPIAGQPAYALADDVRTDPFGEGSTQRVFQMGDRLETVAATWAENRLAVVENGEIVGTVDKARVGSAPPAADSYLQLLVKALKEGQDNPRVAEAIRRGKAAVPNDPVIGELAARFALVTAGKPPPALALKAFWSVPSAVGVAYVARPGLADALTLAQPVQITALKGDKAEITFGVSGNVDLSWDDGSVRARRVTTQRATVEREALSTEPFNEAMLKRAVEASEPAAKANALGLLDALSPSAEHLGAFVDAALAAKSYGLVIDERSWRDDERAGFPAEDEFKNSASEEFNVTPYLLFGCRGNRDKALLDRCYPGDACNVAPVSCIEMDMTELCIPELVSTKQDTCADQGCRMRVREAEREHAEKVKELMGTKRDRERAQAKIQKAMSGPKYFRFAARRLLKASRTQDLEPPPAAEPAVARVEDSSEGDALDAGATDAAPPAPKPPPGMTLFLYRLSTKNQGSGPCETSTVRGVDAPDIRRVTLAPTDVGSSVVYWVEIPQYEDSEYGAALAPGEEALRRWIKTRPASQYNSARQGPPERVEAPFPLTRVDALVAEDCNAACE